LNAAVAQPDDSHGATAQILDTLAKAEAGRFVGAEVEAVTEHGGQITCAGFAYPRTQLHFGPRQSAVSGTQTLDRAERIV